MKKLATLVLCALMLFSTVMPVTTLAKTKKCTHKNTTWVTTSKATCTATGTKVKKCKNCGKILKTKQIAKTAHTYKSKTFTKATCTSPKIVIKVCTKCKQQIAFEKVGKPLGHYWHSWKKNPITGKVSRSCYHCKVRQYK